MNCEGNSGSPLRSAFGQRLLNWKRKTSHRAGLQVPPLRNSYELAKASSAAAERLRERFVTFLIDAAALRGFGVEL